MKEIKDFPNYRISKDGTVYSRYIPKSSTQKVDDIWKPLKPVLDKRTGYLLVTLVEGTKRYNKRIHRLLMETFVPNPLNKAHVNHIDGNKLNNCLTNLEWATPKENAEHAQLMGLNDARTAKLSKEVEQYDEQGNLINTFKSTAEASRATGVVRQNIGKVCQGLRPLAGGFFWKYK